MSLASGFPECMFTRYAIWRCLLRLLLGTTWIGLIGYVMHLIVGLGLMLYMIYNDCLFVDAFLIFVSYRLGSDFFCRFLLCVCLL